MKRLEKPIIKLPYDTDEECVDLCNLLNTLPGLETIESCCGHCRELYMVFFRCDNLDTLTRLGRAVDKRYSDYNFEIVLDTCDSNPKNRFWLRSRIVFETPSSMKNSVRSLINNIGYWFSDVFDDYFDSDGEISDCTEQERTLSWTTVKESQRLLACGLSPETADATYVFSPIWTPHWDFVPTITSPDDECDDANTLPCWTIGKLINILRNDFPYWNVTMDTQNVFAVNGVVEWAFLKSTLIENVVECLVDILNYGKENIKKSVVIIDNGHGK